MTGDRRYLDQKEASVYLDERWGLMRAPSTLSKLRCVGGGPVFRKFGRFPRYTPTRLDEYAIAQLSPELTSTSQIANPGGEAEIRALPSRERKAPLAALSDQSC